MTVQELLAPRYKVIADYPKSLYKIGDILFEDEEGGGWIRHTDDFYTDYTKDIKKYPHLFKKLEWWEDRKLEYFPEYVKFIKDYMNFKEGQVFEYDNWHLGHDGAFCIGFKTGDGEYDKCAIPAANNRLMPATKEEYDQYLLSKNGK